MPFELAQYTVRGQQRVLYGQVVHRWLRVTDRPARGHGRAYLVDRLDPGDDGALRALLTDYLSQARALRAVPMSNSVLRHVEELEAPNERPWAA